MTRMRTNQDEDEARRFRSINSNGDEHGEDDSDDDKDKAGHPGRHFKNDHAKSMFFCIDSSVLTGIPAFVSLCCHSYERRVVQ